MCDGLPWNYLYLKSVGCKYSTHNTYMYTTTKQIIEWINTMDITALIYLCILMTPNDTWVTVSSDIWPISSAIASLDVITAYSNKHNRIIPGDLIVFILVRVGFILNLLCWLVSFCEYYVWLTVWISHISWFPDIHFTLTLQWQHFIILTTIT